MSEEDLRRLISKAIEGVTVPLIMTDVMVALRQGIEHGVRFCHAELNKKAETVPETWGTPAPDDPVVTEADDSSQDDE